MYFVAVEGGNTDEPTTPPAGGDTTSTAPVVGTGYNVYVDAEALGGKVYITGETGSSAWYLATSADVANAAVLYVEAVDGVAGAYRLYFEKDGVKTYIRCYERDAENRKGSIELVTTAPAEYYTYDETYKTLVVTSPDGTNKYYIGTYTNTSTNVTYETLSCSKYSYLSETNVGVTQFPMYFVAVEGGDNGGESGGNTDEPTTPPESGEEGDEEDTITISDLIKADAVAGTYEVTGTVIATNAKSFLLQDATGMILVYTSSAPTVAAGDVVTVKGTTSKYNDTWQFGNTGLTVNKTGDATVTHPTATVVDGAKLDTYAAPIAPEYIQVTGQLVVSNGTYFNLVVAGATKMQGSLTYLAGDLKTAATALVGKKVTVTGYTTGISSGKYVNLMVTEVVEATATDAEKVAIEKEDLTIKTTFSANENLTLPATGTAYTEVVITWTVNGETVTGTYAIVQTDADQFLTVVATITAGTETATKEFTVKIAAISNVTISELTMSFADATGRTTSTTTQQIFVQNGITFTYNKGSYNNNLAEYVNPMRCYAGTSITIEAGSKTITKIVFECNSNSYAEALVNSIGSMSGVTVTQSAKVVTVEFADGVTSFNIAKLSAQVRINKFTVSCY